MSQANKKNDKTDFGGGSSRSKKVGASADKKGVTKPKMLSMRMTDDQFYHLEEMIRLIESETGTKVTKSSLVLKLIEFGKPTLEKLYPAAFANRLHADINFGDDSEPSVEAEIEFEKKKRFFFFN